MLRRRETAMAAQSISGRALHQHHDHNDFRWDVTMHGLALGAVLRF